MCMWFQIPVPISWCISCPSLYSWHVSILFMFHLPAAPLFCDFVSDRFVTEIQLTLFLRLCLLYANGKHGLLYELQLRKDNCFACIDTFICVCTKASTSSSSNVNQTAKTIVKKALTGTHHFETRQWWSMIYSLSQDLVATKQPIRLTFLDHHGPQCFLTILTA